MPVARHRKSRTPIHNVWQLMLQRCNNPNHPRYGDWGGRGITVCERWFTFENFFADMGDRPSPQHSIDRINNDKGYSKENCRWATKAEQVKNQRRRKDACVFQGQRARYWAKEWGVSERTAQHRIQKTKASEETAARADQIGVACPPGT